MRKPSDPKMRVTIKRPDERYGHVTHISGTLENMQKTVGGYIEVITLLEGKGIVCICNEDGKNLGLENNFRIPGDIVVGTVIICRADGEELTDLPVTWGLAEWKYLLSLYEQCDY